jgi:hypothetical protein
LAGAAKPTPVGSEIRFEVFGRQSGGDVVLMGKPTEDLVPCQYSFIAADLPFFALVRLLCGTL